MNTTTTEETIFVPAGGVKSVDTVGPPFRVCVNHRVIGSYCTLEQAYRRFNSIKSRPVADYATGPAPRGSVIEMEMRAPFTVYVNGGAVGEYATEREAAEHYNRLAGYGNSGTERQPAASRPRAATATSGAA